MSVGVATLDGRIPDLAGLYAMADQRLYAAKAAGRDRVVGEVSDESGEAASLRA